MVNFFDNRYSPTLFTDTAVWCADNRSGAAAYITVDGGDKFAIASVCNEKQREVTFVAIDHNIDLELPTTGTTARLCDAMLCLDKDLYFIELKDTRRAWITDAKEQLMSTINIFRQHHNLSDFKKKRAYACNKVHPQFSSLEIEEIHKFRRATGGFKLFVEGHILIT